MAVLSGDCYVVTRKGLKTLSTITPEDELLTPDGYRSVGVKGVGEQEVFSVKTKSGYEVFMAEGSLYVERKGWVPIEGVDQGEKVKLLDANLIEYPTDYSFPVDPSEYRRRPYDSEGRNKKHFTREINLPEQWTEEFAEFLGFLVGDGHLGLSNYVVSMCLGKERGLEDHLGRTLESICGKYRAFERAGSYDIEVYSKALVEFLMELGVTTAKAPEKVVPHSVLVAPKEIVAAFLRGLFTADGSVWVNTKPRAAVLSTTSEKLAKLVHLLLFYLGVRARVSPYTFRKAVLPSGKEASAYVVWYVIVSRMRDVFGDVVGFFGEKQERLSLVNQKYPVRRFKNPYVDRFASVEPLRTVQAYKVTSPIFANGVLVY